MSLAQLVPTSRVTVLLTVLLLAMVASANGVAHAQDTPDPAATDAVGDEPAPSGSVWGKDGLWVSFGWGQATTDEFNTSIQNGIGSLRTISTFDLGDQDLGRASIGWQLKANKGDLRLNFRGYDAQEYSFESTGVVSGQDEWLVTIEDGRLSSGAVDFNPSFSRSVPDPIGSKLQTVDLFYGREFGTRRFASHWWAGLRYYEYEGNVLAGAWLQLDAQANIAPDDAGGFTDGAALPLVNVFQESNGIGPAGAWDVLFNFLESGIQLYVRGESSLVLADLETDSGPFSVLVRDGSASPPETRTVPARLEESRSKTSWQNSVEAGAKFNLRNGLTFEVGYQIAGFLDVQLLPSNILLPETVIETTPCAVPDNCVSSLFVSRDYLVDSWHASVGFQF